MTHAGMLAVGGGATLASGHLPAVSFRTSRYTAGLGGGAAMRATEGGQSAGARGPCGSAWPLSQHDQSERRCLLFLYNAQIWEPLSCEHSRLFVDLPGKWSSCCSVESPRLLIGPGLRPLTAATVAAASGGLVEWSFEQK